MHPPLDSPAVWRGQELTQRENWQLTLTAEEIAELQQSARAAVERGTPVEQLTAADFPLPSLATRLASVQQTLEQGAGVTQILGFPLADLSQEESTAAYWGILSHLGTPLPQTAAGQRIFHVRDEGLPSDHPQARGPSSRKGLSFHTDRCDVIGFLCLAQAKSGGDNELVSAAALYNELLARRPDLVEVLQQPYYYQRHNVDPANERPYYQQPVFSFYEGHFTCQLLRVLIERAYQMPEVADMTPAQREALDLLEAVAEEPDMQIRLRQQPSEILLLNNLTVLHRRTEFEDFAEPERKRHLLRIWLATPCSRPLDPAFAVSYGATAAGAIRGGMFQRH